jgi:hypothetical protein
MRSWLAFLLCPILSGCFAFGYPSVSQTPTLVVPGTDVHAFRFTSDWGFSGPWITGPMTVSQAVEEIPVVEGRIDPQRNAYFAYGYTLFPILSGSHSRHVTVLLYRPGYETVEVPTRSWWRSVGGDQAERVVWKEASDLAAQEKAIERIADPFRPYPGEATCHFIAQEYTRLARGPFATAAETRERLVKTAATWEERAAGRER